MNKYLAFCGICSRRKAALPILEGRVQVNQTVVTDLGTVIDPDADTILLDGKPVTPPMLYRYILLNKPAGTITSAVDGRGRRTVLDLVSTEERIFPVGRLDYDTEGVLLLTNDGDLAYRLTHPKFVVEKVYQAWVEGRVLQKALKRLKEGVLIDESLRVSGETQVVRFDEEKTLVEIRIHQGKKRQIKRMMKAVGHPVITLKRVCFAGITVGELKSGEWCDLAEKEVADLYHMVGLEKNNSSKPETPSVHVPCHERIRSS